MHFHQSLGLDSDTCAEKDLSRTPSNATCICIYSAKRRLVLVSIQGNSSNNNCNHYRPSWSYYSERFPRRRPWSYYSERFPRRRPWSYYSERFPKRRPWSYYSERFPKRRPWSYYSERFPRRRPWSYLSAVLFTEYTGTTTTINQSINIYSQ